MENKAIDDFIATCWEIVEMCNRIADFHENHCEIGPDEVTWAHVSDNEHVIEQLREIMEFIGLEEDDEL